MSCLITIQALHSVQTDLITASVTSIVTRSPPNSTFQVAVGARDDATVLQSAQAALGCLISCRMLLDGNLDVVSEIKHYSPTAEQVNVDSIPHASILLGTLVVSQILPGLHHACDTESEQCYWEKYVADSESFCSESTAPIKWTGRGQSESVCFSLDSSRMRDVGRFAGSECAALLTKLADIGAAHQMYLAMQKDGWAGAPTVCVILTEKQVIPHALPMLAHFIQSQHRALQPCALVTGGLGFIGSYVVEHVMGRMPHTRVVVLDMHSYASSVRNIASVAMRERFFLECANLQNIDSVRDVLQRHRPTMILHLAAESHVDKSFGNSITFTKSNTLGTHVLLEACREHLGPKAGKEPGSARLRFFVHMSTDEVYGPGNNVDEKGHSPETSLLMPTNPYSATKASAEMMCRAYIESFQMPIAIVRCNNVYGPRQFPEKALPRFTLQLASGVRCTLHGGGHSMRSFLHARDAARAILTIALTASSRSTVNVHSPDEISMRALARVVRDILGERCPLGMKFSQFTTEVENRAFNDYRYLVDGTELARLGWAPCVPFEKGMKDTVNWYVNDSHQWFMPCDLERAARTTGHVFGPTAEQYEFTKTKDDSVVLLYGATGWVGGQFASMLRQQGFTVVAATSRMQNLKDVWNNVVTSKASRVINAAGITGRPNIDWCEIHPVPTVEVNLVGAVNLARVCNTLGVHLTNFATGCIYTYDESKKHGEPGLSPDPLAKPFTELDPPNFFGSTYSRVKAHAEQVQKQMANVLLLRLRMPLNEDLHHPRNLVAKLLKYQNVITTKNSVSVLPTLLPVAAHMLQNKECGVYNFTNSGCISPSDILNAYKKHVDPTHTWTEVTARQLEQLGVIVAKRSNCFLDASKIQLYCTRHNLNSIPDALTAIDSVTNAGGDTKECNDTDCTNQVKVLTLNAC